MVIAVGESLYLTERKIIWGNLLCIIQNRFIDFWFVQYTVWRILQDLL